MVRKSTHSGPGEKGEEGQLGARRYDRDLLEGEPLFQFNPYLKTVAKRNRRGKARQIT